MNGMSDKLEGIMNSMTPELDRFVVGELSNSIEGMAYAVEDIINEMNNKMIEVADDITHKMQDAAGKMANKVEGVAHLVGDATGNMAGKMQGATGNMVNRMQGVMKSFGDTVSGVVSEMMNTMKRGITNGLTLTNIFANGFGVLKLVMMFITMVVPMTTTMVGETKKVSVTIFGSILPKVTYYYKIDIAIYETVII